MMTKDELEAKLPFDELGFGWIWLDLTEAMIPVGDFIKRFNGEGASLSYDWLYNHDNATPLWKEQFTAWKQKGILS